MMDNSKLIRTTELAKKLDVSPRTVSRWVFEKKLDVIGFSPGYKYITSEQLKKLLTPVYFCEVEDKGFLKDDD